MAAIVANCAISLNCELTQPVKVQYIDGNMFSMDNAGNTAHVYVFYNGEPQEIVGSVSADVIRSDGTTVAITGAMSGNRAYVIFPQSCYAVPGVVSVVIKVTEGTTVTTIAAFVANVYRSSTDAIVDPGTIIPSVQNLISAIETAVASIPADYSSLWESLAPDYTDITFPVTAGKYCTYNGTLYIAKVDIATTESFTAAHWQSTNIGDNLSALKSAINTTDNTFMQFTGATDSLCIDAYENGSITANTGENSDYRKNARARTKEQTIAPFALTLAPFNTSGESTDFYVVVVSYNADGSWKETSDQIKEGSTYTIAKGQRYRLLIGDTTRQAAASVIPLSDLIAHVKVYSDFIGMIDDVEFLELSDAADGVIKTGGGDGSFSDSTVSIVKKDGVVTINGTYSASARRRVKLTGDFAQNSSIQAAWYANTEAVLPGGRVFGVEPIELGGSATISDDSYALNILAYNTSGTLIMSAYLYADGWVINNVSSSNTDVNVGLVMLTINKDYTFSNYKISYRIIEQLANGMAYVDYTSGKDDQFGAKKFPLKTIGKALSLGFRHICATPKVYNEKISLTGGEFELIPWVDDQAYDDDTAPYRPKIKLIKGTKLTVSTTGTTGIYQASYTASSGTNIYKVFVDHSVNPTTSGSLALEYNALLVGDMPNTSTASKAFSPYQQRLFTPVLTEEELSAEGTFWYDDTNHLIKFHAWNDTADGEYYIPDDDADNGIALTKMDRVHLEDVKVLGFYTNCININKCDDVTVNACEVGYCAKGMGLKLDYANARVSDCHAYAISVDGFNLHGYGYSEIVGCTAFYCGDDGISHHEGCSGFIDGGEWAYNGSGGITPAFGAQIDVRNVYAHHNSIGIQWIGLGTQCRYTKMVGCLAVDNTKDVYVKWYVVYAWNNVFRVKDNVYSSARSNLIEYGTVTPE